MGGKKSEVGFSLIETLIALALVAIAMTGLLVAFVGSGKFGVLARRQANAVALGRSIASQLEAAPWGDARLANTNAGNDFSDKYADPKGLFALPTLPTGASAPDASLGAFKVGDESYDVYVNVLPDAAQGLLFAVIVRYRVGNQAGGTFMRAVVLGYRYNPATIGVGALPI
jgi:prepilin-type N-terminal cleavage/methylation domain-containing protein